MRSDLKSFIEKKYSTYFENKFTKLCVYLYNIYYELNLEKNYKITRNPMPAIISEFICLAVMYNMPMSYNPSFNIWICFSLSTQHLRL